MSEKQINPSIKYFDLTPELDSQYDELDAQGVLTPVEIRERLGLNTVNNVVVAITDDNNPAVARLERGGRYGPNNHFSPSDRDVDNYSSPYPLPPISHGRSQVDAHLWSSFGYLAATEALNTAKVRARHS